MDIPGLSKRLLWIVWERVCTCLCKCVYVHGWAPACAFVRSCMCTFISTYSIYFCMRINVYAYECMWCLLCSCIHESVYVCDRSAATAGRMGVSYRQCATLRTFSALVTAWWPTSVPNTNQARLFVVPCYPKTFLSPLQHRLSKSISSHAWQRMSHHGYFRLRFSPGGL
jgi:hypothetical protein